MKNLYNFFIAASISVFYILFAAFVMDRHDWILFATLSFTFLIGYIIYNIRGFGANRKRFFLFVLPITTLFLGTAIFQENSVVRAFSYIFLIPFVSYLAIVAKQKAAWWSIPLAFSICAFIGLVLFPNWFSFYINYNSHVNEPIPELEIMDEDGHKVNFPQNKIVVLDLWSTSCRACIAGFSDFEELYLEYKDNPNIVFYSVNIPVKRDTFPKTLELVAEYDFQTVFSRNYSPVVMKKLDFEGYPWLLILKNGKIRYSGQLVMEKLIIVHSLENEIERLLD